MMLVPAIVLLACFTAIVWQYWERLMGEEIDIGRRWFWTWYIKGLATPIGIWILLGAGGIPGLRSLLGRTKPTVLGSTLDASALGIIIISSYWAAITLAWMLATVAGRVPEENRSHWKKNVAIWSVPLLFIAGLGVHTGGWQWAGFIATVCLFPLAHGTVAFFSVEKVVPQYTAAIAKMKFGRFDEAEWEVIHQLEECEDDFQGWMMLAELYACHFNDLPAAVQTVHDVCNQPNITASDVGVAMHKLADWHLKLGDDPYSARQALEEICRRYPGSHLDKMARMRINQLPATVEELRASRTPRLFKLPSSKPAIEAPQAPEVSLTKEDALTLVNECTKRLQAEPNDVGSREQFARLLAERLSRPDLAIEQLQLLLAMPEQPSARRAGWLRLLADWQLRLLRDAEAGVRTLRTLIEIYPETGEAFDAQRRLTVMDLESRWRKR